MGGWMCQAAKIRSDVVPAISTEFQVATCIQDLPEDVVMCIMSTLPLSDIFKFSMASKQWLHIPALLNSITVDISMCPKNKDTNFTQYNTKLRKIFANIIGWLHIPYLLNSFTSSQLCPKNKDSFVQGVHEFLQYNTKLRSMLAVPMPLLSFTLSVCLTTYYYNDIDTWILTAISTSVTSLTILLHCPLIKGPSPMPDDQKYIFPWKVLDHHQKSPTLKKLTLRSCVFDCRLTSKWISLQALDLIDTVVTEYDMSRLSHCFPNLHHFVLLCCRLPPKLTITSHVLTYLKVMVCSGLEEIDLRGARELEEFNYQGESISLDQIRCPKLTNLTFGFWDVKGDKYVFQNLPIDFLRITSLSILRDRECVPPKPSLHQQISSFIHLDKLKLHNHPARGINRQAMAQVLRACPVLTTLDIVPPCVMDDEDGMNSPGQPLHKHLAFIKIRGVCGSKNNTDMVKFLVQVSEALNHVVIEQKVDVIDYLRRQHFANWHGDEEPEAFKNVLLNLMKRGKLTFL